MAKKNLALDSGLPRIVVPSNTLRKALAFVGGAITTNPIVPVLENVKCYVHEGTATLTGSNLQITMWVNIPVEQFNGHTDGDLFLLPHRLTSQLITTFGAELAIITVDPQTFGQTLASKAGTYKVSADNPVDYPSQKPGSSSLKSVTFSFEGSDRQAFVAGLTTAVFAVSDDHLRPSMTGVNLKGEGKSLALNAADGRRLIQVPVELLTDIAPVDIILSAKFISLLNKMNGEVAESEPLTMTVTGTSILATLGQYNIQAQLIDERYPDFTNPLAIARANDREMSVDMALIQEAVKRILLVSNQTTNQIRLTLTSESLTISAEDLDYSNEGLEKLDATYEGDTYEIGFNGKLLLSCLSHLEGGTLRMRFSDPNKAVLLYGENEAMILMLMPVMLNVYA